MSHVELLEDAALSPGGCRIFTAGGCVDGDLDVQLDRVIAQLLPVDDAPGDPQVAAVIASPAPAPSSSPPAPASASPTPPAAKPGK